MDPMTDELIAVRNDLRIGPHVYLPADKIDVANALKHAYLTPETVRHLQMLGHFAKLEREAFQIALARRPAGAPWPPKGFTEPYLIEKGVWDAPPAPTKAKKAAKAEKGAKQNPKATGVPLDHVTLGDDKIAVGPYFLQPVKKGNFTFYTATDKDGRLLRERDFTLRAKGEAFLTDLAKNSTAGAPAATSASGPAREEQQHDGDVPR